MVWIFLPNLPLVLFVKSCLFSIGKHIGSPLTHDSSTAELTHPSVAQFCVEVDLLKRLPQRIWLECGENFPSFWQDVIYEKVPSYYKHCRRIVHDVSSCKMAHPDLAKKSLQGEDR